MGVRVIDYQKTGKILCQTQCIESNCIRTLLALGAFFELKTTARLALSSLFNIKLINEKPLPRSFDSGFYDNDSKYNKNPCNAL